MVITAHQIGKFGERREATRDAARMHAADRNLLWCSQFLNLFAFDGVSAEGTQLAQLAATRRA